MSFADRDDYLDYRHKVLTGHDPDACDRCMGAGELWRAIGGDGYGDRCAGTMDVPTVCPDCDGTGRQDEAP